MKNLLCSLDCDDRDSLNCENCDKEIPTLDAEPESINETLNQREKTYGDFRSHAVMSQNLKQAMENANYNWTKLSMEQKEALEMIVHKIARILNGDPNYADNWRDIAGYATLIERLSHKGGA